MESNLELALKNFKLNTDSKKYYVHDNINNRQILTDTIGDALWCKNIDTGYIEIGESHNYFSWRTTFDHEWLYSNLPTITNIDDLVIIIKASKRDNSINSILDSPHTT